MDFKIRFFLLCLLLFFSFYVVEAQENIDLPIQSSLEEGVLCVIPYKKFVELNVSVSSDKKGDLKDLIYKDFEVYDEKELQEITYFKFDELKKQYTIGFYPKYLTSDDEWRNVKVKIKLSQKKKKDYGKISVKAQKGYYSGNLKSKI